MNGETAIGLLALVPSLGALVYEAYDLWLPLRPDEFNCDAV